MVLSKLLGKQDEEKLVEVMRKEIFQRPPTIGVIGVSGVGKSSTINTMFRTNLPTSATVASTMEFSASHLEVVMRKGKVEGTPVSLRMVDAPGLGEDVDRDEGYLEMYREHLPKCDVILWLIAARVRAIALEQRYLLKLRDFHSKIIFGLNQVDLVEPLDWDDRLNLPSESQERNIDAIVEDRKRRLQKIMTRPVVLIPYSAKRGYNLQTLFTALLDACPADRAWIFSGLQAFRYLDFLPKGIPEKFREGGLGQVEEAGP